MNEQGVIIDVDGQTVLAGTATLHGIVSDSNGVHIGHICGMAPPLAILYHNNEEFGTVRWVQGMAVDNAGVAVGSLHLDGSVRDTKGNVLSGYTTELVTLDDQGDPMLPCANNGENGFLGYMLASYSVAGADTQASGTAMPDGSILHPDGKPIGRMNTGGCTASRTAVDIRGKPLGYLQPDCSIVDPCTGKTRGFMTPSGQVLHSNGYYIGSVQLMSLDGTTLTADGTLLDKAGNVIGRVNKDGALVMNDGTVQEAGQLLPEALQLQASHVARGSVVCFTVLTFSKLIVLFFGYFDPEKILSDTKNK